MRCITTILFYLLCLLLSSDVHSQIISSAHQDTLEAINERIKLGEEQDDLGKFAKGYYDRAMHNFHLHINYQDVVTDLVSSARIYRLMRDDVGFYKSRLALANFYIDQEFYLDDAIKLTIEADAYYKDNGMVYDHAKAISQLGRAYQKKLDYEQAISYVEQGLKTSIELGDVDMELNNRLLITRLLGNLGNVEKVIEQGEYIIRKEQSLNVQSVSAEANFLIGSNLLMDDQVSRAKNYLKNAVSLNQGVNDLAYQCNSLLSKTYFSLDSMVLAYQHLEEANRITTELYSQEKYALANKIAVEYQSNEKDKEIRELEEDNQNYEFKLTQRTRLFLIISILLSLAALAAYNFYRLQKQRFEMESLLAHQKEEIADQKINELENTLKIENLQSMVLGQEAERSRISQDLHDSLGGTLSTLKLQYDALQLDHNDLSVDSEYQRIMSMIDNACTEVRDIARNLKPISLEKLGLTAALKDLVNRYSIKGVMDISLHTHDIDGVLSEEAKLHVYRIIQELLNNSLKHANASEIDVQVNKREDALFIMVEDDGTGFVHSKIKPGLGFGNLQSRVNVLRGEMEIDSTQDRGTSVTVHIPLHTAQFENTRSKPDPQLR